MTLFQRTWPFPRRQTGGTDGLEQLAFGRRSLLAGLGATAGAFAFPAPLWAASATAVRLGRHDSTTRVVLELSEKLPFSYYTLSDPSRVVVDFPEISWNFQDGGVFGGGGLVSSLRFGLFQAGNSRIVFDLSSPAAVKQAFVLPPGDGAGWRFVMDLERVSPEAFAAAAGPDHRSGSFRPPAPRPAAAEEGPAHAPTAQEARKQETRPPEDRKKGKKDEPRPSEATQQDEASADDGSAAQSSSPPRRGNNRKPVIILDPGHGGVDPGTTGVSGVYEKNITLAAAREFKAMLEKDGRYTIYMTRNSDVFVQLRDRPAVGRRHAADLFISIHADANPNPSTKGLSIYTLSEKSSDSEAAALAEAENKADIIAGIDLSQESPEVTNILIDLAQRETMNLSSRLAETMVGELRREVQLLPKTHRFAGFAVLKAPDVPSVLMEMGYLSNAEEDRLLRTATYRAKLGDSLVRSVGRYFTQLNKNR